ncbi:uncharacterized protein EV420DRAFT_1589089 [Desarmillaria tabescens]|uniref:Uncharacterized protein n=1 Tax=Armillaria tabescens TaxID=1929756 RepID=A0AA39J7H4_ARMTA|nr:uncharacterized protein EV420DRAFT_1589089 [Desarmillaria tabescens]KAK0437084.1 hypothetical protein EV420DRAFT_1589089 [Desarmillaria tabescens]
MTRITSESITSYSRPSHRIRQNKSRKYSTAPVVKSELKEEQLDDITLSILASPSRELGWKEVDYLDASSWSKDEIIKHLITNSFSVPGRTHRSKWATITSADGSTTVVPNLYRIPLMFVGQFMWSSLRLVLGDDKEWAEFKTGILHVSRLCEAFLGEVRRAMSEGIGRSWRCAIFDTALVRYRMGWLLSEPKHLKEFWEMYGEEEYRKDVVKFDWKKLVLRGIKGFKLDEEQVEDGITAIQWMSGLKELSGDWFWDTSDNPLSGKNASEYLESWQRTKTWEMSPPPILPTHNEAVPVKPQPQSGACCTANAATIDINWDSLALTVSSPSPELFRLLYRKLQLQDERIAVLEKEVSMLSALQAVKTPVVIPDSAPIFVPTQNFLEMSDPDCTAGFWNDPLEKFLDMDMDEVTADVKNESDIERVEISSIPGQKDDITSAPIKSLRKLQRMEG